MFSPSLALSSSCYLPGNLAHYELPESRPPVLPWSISSSTAFSTLRISQVFVFPGSFVTIPESLALIVPGIWKKPAQGSIMPASFSISMLELGRNTWQYVTSILHLSAS